MVTDIWVSKFITDIEYRELKISFHKVWLASPWRHEINEEDALSTMVSENPYYTLIQFQAASQKYLNKEHTATKRFEKSIEDKRLKIKHDCNKVKEKCNEDPEYRIKLNEGKSISKKKQKDNNSLSYQKGKDDKKIIRNASKTVQKTKEGIYCELSTGKCLRKRDKRQNNHKACPLTDKFCLKNSKCYPKKIDSAGENAL